MSSLRTLNEINYNFVEFGNRFPYVQMKTKEPTKYNFNLLVLQKPFIYCDRDNVSNLFVANNTCYGLWDEAVAKIIIKYPELSKYFEFIKTFRYTLF